MKYKILYFIGFVPHQRGQFYMYISKKLEDLNLIDSFLFSATTENPKDAELIAKLIIERATGKKVKEISVISEKQLLGISINQHGIRMDLYVTEYQDQEIVKVYDIEPNKYNVKEIPRRSRYNQALTDVKLLSAGDQYENLVDYISIWILTEDPFGKNRMIYTVQNSVVEDSHIVYNDGVKKLFLYVNGEIGGNAQLQNLLQYFSDSNLVNAVDEDIRQLHEIVKKVKDNCEVEDKYMRFMTYQEFAKFEAEQEMKKRMEEEIAKAVEAEATKTGINTLVKTARKFGASDEEIISNLMEEYKLSEEAAKTYLIS